jgi:hypothetical protein
MQKIVADYILRNSVNAFNSIELTTVVGCARKCTYCPQDLILGRYKQIRGDGAQKLKPADLEKMLANMPSEMMVFWTGFAEPLQNDHFPDLFDLISGAGYASQISTTLFASNRQSIQVLCDRKKWDRVTLHLPDNSGQMLAEITPRYLGDLREVVHCMDPAKDLIHVFGELNNDIRRVFEEPGMRDVVSKIKTMLIDLDSPLKTTRANNIHSDQPPPEPKAEDGFLFCKEKRFNQPVLLPNGDLSMCCMDYGLTNIVGNLLHESYDSIVKRSSIYMSHNLPPLCFNCEWSSRFRITE